MQGGGREAGWGGGEAGVRMDGWMDGCTYVLVNDIRDITHVSFTQMFDM